MQELAKVIQFPGPRKSREPLKPFEVIQEDQGVRRRVAQTICRLTNKSDVALSTPQRILLSRRREEPGAIEVYQLNPKEYGIITSSNFAEWLSNHTELDAETSDGLAEHYTSAFGAIHKRLNVVYARANGSYVPPYWRDEYQRAPLRRLPYRVAGMVALTASELSRLEIPEQEYPPHIAGLANPLELHEFKELHDCFKIGIGEQGELGCD